MTASVEGPVPGAGPWPCDLVSLAEGKASPMMLRELLREVIDPEMGARHICRGAGEFQAGGVIWKC